ncbi:hypothetical protein BH11MYX2_BH11MYX2_20650 [soil metagenome]
MTRFALLAALFTACVNAPKFNGIESEGDAGAPDAAMGDASVFATMRNGSGSPQPGVHVVFTDAFGTITYEGDTDGPGNARGAAVEGGTLFAAYSSPPVLVVIMKIKPGVTYNIGEPHYLVEPRPPTAAMSVSRSAGSTVYEARARCGSGTTTDATTSAVIAIPFTWTDACASGETVSVMSVAKTGAAAVASHYLEVPYFASAIAATGAYQPPASVAFTLTAPSDLESMSVAVTAVDRDFPFGGPTAPTIATGETTAVAQYFIAAPTAPLLLGVNMMNGAIKGTMAYVARLAPGTADVTADLSLLARPPYLTSVAIPADPSAAITWTASDGRQPQLGVLDVTLTSSSAPVDPPRKIRYVFPPSDSPALTPPPLPQSDAFRVFQAMTGDVAVGSLYEMQIPATTVDYAALALTADPMLYIGAALAQQLLAVPGVSATFLTVSQ